MVRLFDFFLVFFFTFCLLFIIIARGLDIKTIQTVVNFDVARDIESHIHRIGRTCRAGNSDGIAYTLIGPNNKSFAGLLLQNLESAHQPVPPELTSLAMLDPKYRQKHSGRGGFRGGRGNSAPKSSYPNQSYSGNRGGGIGFSSSNNTRNNTGRGRINFRPASS